MAFTLAPALIANDGPVRNNDRRDQILTSPEWTERTVPLGTGRDSLITTPDPPMPALNLDETAAAAAVHRIAESINLRTRIFDADRYSLTEVFSIEAEHDSP